MMGATGTTGTAVGRRAWLSACAVAALLVCGTVVFWPALHARFYFDDHFHASMLAGSWPTPRSPLDLYHFVGEGDRAELMNRGVLPWWSSPQLRVRFLRPLSSLLLAADHRWLAGSPRAMHAHSWLWWCACVLGARGLYRRVLPARAAWIATVVFALAPCHVVALAWLANREALVSLAFGIAALTALLRWLDSGRFRDAAWATGASTLALLGGEYALSLLGYFAAIAVLRRDVAVRRRAWGFASFAAPATAYLGVRWALHCGARGAGFYVDPFNAPGVFLRAAPRRFASLLSEAWLGLDGRTLDGAPTWARISLAALLVAIVWVPLRRVFSEADTRYGANLRWLLAGAILALVPVLAVAASPRVLGASMCGFAAIVAAVLDSAWWPAAPEDRSGASEWTKYVATALGFAHLVHGPASAWSMGRQFRDVTLFFENNAERLAPSLSEFPADLVVLRGLGAAFYLPFALEARRAKPATWSILAQGAHVLVLRTGPRTLELAAPAGSSLFPSGQDQLFRSDEELFRRGDHVVAPGMRVEVLEVSAAGPRRARFTFDHDLGDGTTQYLSENTFGVAPVTLPEIGFGLPLSL